MRFYASIKYFLAFFFLFSFFPPTVFALDAPLPLPLFPGASRNQTPAAAVGVEGCVGRFDLAEPRWYEISEFPLNGGKAEDCRNHRKYSYYAFLTTKDEYENVVSWYKKVFKDQGWQIQNETDQGFFMECTGGDFPESEKIGCNIKHVDINFYKGDPKVNKKDYQAGTLSISDHQRACLPAQHSGGPNLHCYDRPLEDIIEINVFVTTDNPWLGQRLSASELIINSNVENVQLEVDGEYFSGRCSTGNEKQCRLDSVGEIPADASVSVTVSGHREGYYKFLHKMRAVGKNGHYEISVDLRLVTGQALLHFVTNTPGAVFSSADQRCIANQEGDCLIYLPIEDKNDSKTVIKAGWKGQATGFDPIEGENYLISGDERWIWAPFHHVIQVSPTIIPTLQLRPSISAGTGFPLPADICLNGTEVCEIQNRIWQKYHFVLHDAYPDDMNHFEDLLDRLPDSFKKNLFLTEVFIDYQDLGRSILNMASGRFLAGYYDPQEKYLRPIHIIEDLSVNLGFAGTTESNFMHELTHAFQFGFQNNFPWEESFNQDWITSEPLKSWIATFGWKLIEGNWVNETDEEEMVNWYAKTLPYEDMAESVAYYVYHNNELKSKSPDRWEYIKANYFEGWEP